MHCGIGPIRPMSMNNAEITQARSPIAEHFEIVRPDQLPSVTQIEQPNSTPTGFSMETEAGLHRFARFLKKMSKRPSADPKINRALQAYETVANFQHRVTPGQVLNHWR